MTKEEEYALIERVRSGDTEAFEPLVAENQTIVYRLALRMVGNEQDAWDVSQEAFLKAYNALGSFRGESRFSTWLYRLTGNCATDLLRSRKTGKVISLEEVQEQNPAFDPADEATPETELEKNERRRSLNEAFRALPEDYGRILSLREIGGLSYSEIAETLGLEIGTVKSRLNRARGKLCELLQRSGNFPDLVSSKNTEGGKRA